MSKTGKPQRICAIDASTNSLAFAIFDGNELKEVGLASYFLFLVGGKFGIIIFTNNQNIGIFQSMIFTYLLCAAMSILYQRFINRRLTTFIFRNRTT